MKPRSISVSTTGPCGVSMATSIWLELAAPLAESSQAAISAKPSPLCLKIFSPILRPAPSVRKT
jgi:hypothetical protein